MRQDRNGLVSVDGRLHCDDFDRRLYFVGQGNEYIPGGASRLESKSLTPRKPGR